MFQTCTCQGIIYKSENPRKDGHVNVAIESLVMARNFARY